MTAERVAGVTALLSAGALALVLAISAVASPNTLAQMGMPMMSASPYPMTMAGCPMCGGAVPSPSSSAIPGASEVRIRAGDYSFSPSEIYLPKGSSVNVTLVNTSGQMHDITVPGLGLHLVAGAGETRTSALANLSAGRYDAYCSIPGHAQLGMRATFIVD